MMLTDEMYNKALSSDKICTIYDAEYVLLNKKMPVTDDKLKWYVDSLRKLKEDGVNIATIVDYRMIPGTTNSYDNGTVNYTTGIFLEERAKGKTLNSDSIYLSTKKEYDFTVIVTEYLKMVLEYIEELELRASAPQKVFDELLDSCNSIKDVGLIIDPKPLNFFFDKNVGFTIIDVTPGNERAVESYMNFLPNYVFSIVFGYGKPGMSIDYEDCSVLPQEYSTRLTEAAEMLEMKIMLSLKRHGVSDTKIALETIKNKFRYLNKYACVEIEDMENYIATQFDLKKKERESQKKEDSADFTFSW